MISTPDQYTANYVKAAGFCWTIFNRYYRMSPAFRLLHVQDMVKLLDTLLDCELQPPRHTLEEVADMACLQLGKGMDNLVEIGSYISFLGKAGLRTGTNYGDQIRSAVDVLCENHRPGTGWGISRAVPPRLTATCAIIQSLLNCQGHEMCIKDIAKAYDWALNRWNEDYSADNDGQPFKVGMLFSTAAALMENGFSLSEVQRKLLETSAELLIESQLTNGAWTFILKNNEQSLKLALASPMHSSIVLIGIIRMFPYLSPEIQRRLQKSILKGTEYILGSQNEHGFWYVPDSELLINLTLWCVAFLHDVICFEKRQRKIGR